ncbi:MAG TPA: DUF58 domain-containing protein [Gemmatimonadaceae bacterium]|nr:DUF58 domain-containing protein [Gemmatimonadaceae bacterium]
MDTGDVMARVRRLEVTSRRLVRDRLAGEYGSVFKGRGVELADVREYIAGDDVRTIDWRVTARMDAAYVRRYVEERELTVLFVVDRSASAAFGSRLRSKATLAADVCGVLGLAAARNHDRVGAVWFTDRVEQYVAPGKGRRHVLRVIRELMAFAPSGVGTDLAQALAYVNRVTTRRAVVFIVSDWMAAGYERELDVTARRHDTIAVQLVDARERELPDVGLAAVRDPETGRVAYLDTSRRDVRTAYQERGVAFDAAVRGALRRRGIDHIRFETGRDYVAPLLAFFRRRERRRMH